jgi:hypothetical protein
MLQVIPLYDTLLNSSSPFDCKMSDYVLLKKAKIYIDFKNKRQGVFMLSVSYRM